MNIYHYKSSNYASVLLLIAFALPRAALALLPETITGADRLCEGTNATYNLLGSSPGNWVLQTANGGFVASGTGTGFSHTFTMPGNYRLSATGSNFCPPEDFIIQVVPTPDIPDVITGPDRACINLPTKYEAGNPIAGTTFKWFVTGGGTVNAERSDYSYITFATLPAIVKAVRVTTDGLECVSDTLYYDVQPPFPTMTISGPNNVCHSSLHSYDISYLDGDDYEWRIADPLLGSVVSGGNTPNPEIQWNIPYAPSTGQNTTLIVTIKKCNSYVNVYYNVFVMGIVEITNLNFSTSYSGSVNTICSGVPFDLEITTTPAITGGTYQVNWGHGNVQTYTSAPINYTYHTTHVDSPLVMHPVVTILDANGCPQSVTGNAPALTVLPEPVTVLSPTGPIPHCGSFSETLTASTSTRNPISSRVWTPNISSGPTGIATAFGDYSVVVTNDYGCESTSNTVVIYDDCTPGIPGNPNVGCGAGPTVSFDIDNYDCGEIAITPTVTPSAPIGVWNANHPFVTIDGVNSTTGQVSATAKAAGGYTFSYRVTYSPGCSKTYYETVIVPYVPELRYSILCDQANGDYEITLHDNTSQYIPNMVTSSSFYNVSAGWTMITSSTFLDAVTHQDPGTTVRYAQIIEGSGYAACTSYVEIVTPEFPNVQVFIDPSNEYFPGCQEHVAFQLGHDILSGTITSWMWDFEPLSSNASNANPIGKVYDIPASYNPTLTVTDIHGCYAQGSVGIIVVANDLKGIIDAAPNPVCQGDAVTLTYYENTNSQTPTSYTWHDQINPLMTTTSDNYNVFWPGGYWVLVKDNYGCRFTTGTEPVDVIQMPPVSIMGNTGACIDQIFTLYTQDYGSAYNYLWSGDASGTGTTLTQKITTAGTYTYYVTIEDAATGCSITSAAFTVTVSSPPSKPTLSFNVLSCDPYELELNASGVAGTYNWSNGMNGPTINTPFGGDYLLTLTDDNGCVVRNSITVPKSLEEYIWVFPKGCFCQPLSGAYLIGPGFPLNWKIIKDRITAASGWGYMPPYSPLSYGSVYNMVLHNNWCTLESDAMYIMSDTCSMLSGGEESGETSPDFYRINHLDQNKNLLEIAPNPAAHQAVAYFELSKGSVNRSLAVVDLKGRILEQHQLKEEKGNFHLDLKSYVPGMYYVLLYRNGIAVQRIKLAVSQ